MAPSDSMCARQMDWSSDSQPGVVPPPGGHFGNVERRLRSHHEWRILLAFNSRGKARLVGPIPHDKHPVSWDAHHPRAKQTRQQVKTRSGDLR